MKINVFLPCKENSVRVKNKNKRVFANVRFGLIKIKLNQPKNAKLINNIYLSTNDKKIIKYAESINNKKIIIHTRKDANLSKNTTMTQRLISHAAEIIPNGHILWTHVTSPFVNSKIYDEVIRKYKQVLKKNYDSLMTVTKLKGFIWNDRESINYNYKKTKWPRTQDIKPLNKINSAIFINSKENFIKYSNRLGKKPFMFELKKYYGLDIDDIEDFYLAEFLFKNKKKYR